MSKIWLLPIAAIFLTSCQSHNLNVEVNKKENGLEGVIDLGTTDLDGVFNDLSSSFSCDEEDSLAKGDSIFSINSSSSSNGEAKTSISIDGKTLDCSIKWNDQ